jgi:hypothetical protein
MVTAAGVLVAVVLGLIARHVARRVRSAIGLVSCLAAHQRPPSA